MQRTVVQLIEDHSIFGVSIRVVVNGIEQWMCGHCHTAFELSDLAICRRKGERIAAAFQDWEDV